MILAYSSKSLFYKGGFMIVTVSEKGQLVIPASFRSMLGISAGTRIELRIESDGFRAYLEPARKTRNAKTCLGVAGYKGPKIDNAQLDANLVMEPK
jgi:AbrB family looped-hinge helix DNA binding protein